MGLPGGSFSHSVLRFTLTCCFPIILEFCWFMYHAKWCFGYLECMFLVIPELFFTWCKESLFWGKEANYYFFNVVNSCSKKEFLSCSVSYPLLVYFCISSSIFVDRILWKALYICPDMMG